MVLFEGFKYRTYERLSNPLGSRSFFPGLFYTDRRAARGEKGSTVHRPARGRRSGAFVGAVAGEVELAAQYANNEMKRCGSPSRLRGGEGVPNDLRKKRGRPEGGIFWDLWTHLGIQKKHIFIYIKRRA